MSYFLTLITIFSIGIILAMSLNLLMGYTGKVSMAHGGFMAIGAYTAAWFSLQLDISMFWTMLIAAIVTAIAGGVFALATARISGDEFILASFALQMILIEAISRWTDVTRGTYGMSGIPKPEVFGIPMTSVTQFAIYTTVIMLICATILIRFTSSSFGIVLRGVRESESSIQSLGRSTGRLKIIVMVISATFAGIAGTLQASLVTFIHPDSFEITLSIIIVAYLLIGGLGNMWGAALGAILLLSIPEFIAATEFIPSNLLGPMERISYGAILMIFILFRPSGIIPERPILNVSRMMRKGVIKTPEGKESTLSGAGKE